jgi:hypothetical protein
MPSGQDLRERLSWHGQAQRRPRLAGLSNTGAAWSAGIAAADEGHFARPNQGPPVTDPLRAVILHLNREVIHHACEVALPRDLCRRRA